MAKRTWIGGDTTAAQVETFDVTAYDATDTYTLNVIDEGGTTETTITAVAAGSDVLTASTLSTNWNASVHPLCTAVTATVSTTTLTLTANVPGVPFYVTGDVAGGGETGEFNGSATTHAGTIATASRGPNDWNDPFNWKEGEIPVTGDADSVVITGGVSILYGLDQSGIAIADFTAAPGSSNEIGSEAFWLQIDPNSFQWWGKGISYVDSGTANLSTPHIIWDTAEAGRPGLAGLYLKHVNTSQDITIYKGDIGMGLTGGDAVTFNEIIIRGERVNLTVGEGCTVQTGVLQWNGTSLFRSTPKAITLHGGHMTTEGVGYTVTTCTIEGGTYIANHTDTLSSISLNGGTLDISGMAATTTIGTTVFNVQPGATFIVDPSVVSWANKISPAVKMRMTFSDA